jgi:probable O-glycosylation ligase (exosortase A-associated)
MRDLLVAALIFGALPFALARPYVGIYLWAWVGLMNPHRLTYGFAYYYPFAQMTAVATLAGLLFSKEPRRFPWMPATTVWLLFIAWMNFTTLFALGPGAMSEWERTMKIQLMAVVTLLTITSRERLHGLVWVIALSLGFFAAKGGVFVLMTGGEFRVMGPRESFIAENNALALALIMTLPLLRYLHLETKNKLVRWGLLGLMVLTAFSIASSHSRGAFLAASMMALVLWLKAPNKMRGVLVVAAVITTVLSFMPEKWFERMETIQTYQADESAMSRIEIWKFAYELALDRPVIGGGFKTFTEELVLQYAGPDTQKYDPHSIYFQVMAEHGFVGLGLFVMLGILAYRSGSAVIAAARDRPDLRWAHNLASMVQVSMVGFAVGGAFLGLAYFDLYYYLVATMVMTRVVVAKAAVRESAGVPVPAAVQAFSEHRT